MRHLSIDDELYGRRCDVSILLGAPGDVLQLALGGVEALEGLGQLLAQLGGLFTRLSLPPVLPLQCGNLSVLLRQQAVAAALKAVNLRSCCLQLRALLPLQPHKCPAPQKAKSEPSYRLPRRSRAAQTHRQWLCCRRHT